MFLVISVPSPLAERFGAGWQGRRVGEGAKVGRGMASQRTVIDLKYKTSY